jgi:hypothetical protein
MKLSEHIVDIERVFAALLQAYDDFDPIGDVIREIHGTRICRDLPKLRDRHTIPRIIPTYTPLVDSIPIQNKEKLLLLAAFEAAYHLSLTPFTPDMVPIVIDTGASVTVTPYATDFTSLIKPVQSVEVKGIASGLQVRGYGDISYQFQNDNGDTQQMILRNCLYVPKCSARLLCPRQLGIASGNPKDGVNALSHAATLTFQGQITTIPYDSVSSLPILYTKPGLDSYKRFCQHQAFLTTTKSDTTISSWDIRYNNLTPNQQRKLHLHEKCNHVHWDQLNIWIREGRLPCDSSLAQEPNPVCATCQFGKAHRKTHKSNTGSISSEHDRPGQGVSSDGLEAGTPGKVMTTHGLPSTKRYRYCSFWIDHYSRFVYVTMHDSKKAEELLKSKLEFEAFAA